jgi:tetratricopeptide (TPR) repeat protein
VALALLPALASADAIILKRGNRLQVWGIASTLGEGANQVEVTPENVGLYAERSTGVIDAEGYDNITCRKTDKTKQVETIPWSEVVGDVFYSSEPDGLVAGLDDMSVGNYAQALAGFKSVAEAADTRETFKYRAQFLMGICYYQSGRVKECIALFKGWKPVNSRWTPEAYRILAELLTEQRQFAEARAQYEEIGKLPGIPDGWKFKARLGGVRVDIAERKFDAAERTTQVLARETQTRPELADAHILSLVLQGEAIWKGGNADRLPEAEGILDRASKLDGASKETRSFLLVTLGSVLYAQGSTPGKVEAARFPYLRAALMYPDTAYEGSAYHNAGLCFVDMSGRLDGKDQAKSDDYLIKGMRLLGTAAGRFKNAEAAKVYRQHKKRYDDLMAKQGGEEGGEAKAAPEEK